MWYESTNLIKDDIAGNLVELLHNFTLIRGTYFVSVPKCLEALEHRINSFKENGLGIVADGFRD